MMCPCHSYEQALVSLKLKKTVDAEGGRTFAVELKAAECLNKLGQNN